MTTILIVEDDLMNREMLTRRLQWEGYQVISATDGVEGVELARAKQPDLILMDMGLPHMDGWQATRSIKGMPETRHIPIIALTAFAFDDDRIKSMAAGCDDYQTKPVDFEQLLGKFAQWIVR